MTKMKRSNIHTVPFRRKRLGETDYKKRLKTLLSGKPRLVVRKSLNNTIVQIMEYSEKGDKTILALSSKSLDGYGWKANKGNLPSAYLLGLLLGRRAKKQEITELVLDMGLNKSVKGSRIYAVLKGVIDAGINVPHSKDILPSEDRIKGAHIVKHAQLLKKDGNAGKIFSDYIKHNIDPLKLTEYFENTRKKIMEAS